MYIVADTNIWLLNPNFYEQFSDCIVVIPQTVIEELDSKKSSFGVYLKRKEQKLEMHKMEAYQKAYRDYHVENVEADDEILSRLYSGTLNVSDLNLNVNTINTPLYFHNNNETILAVIKSKGVILPLKQGKKNSCFNLYGGIKPLNDCQKQFVNMIKDTSIKIVGCIGKTGSGKSLLALSTALQLVLEDGEYSHIKLIKPYVSLSNTVGLLKGSLDEKVSPIKESFNSALE